MNEVYVTVSCKHDSVHHSLDQHDHVITWSITKFKWIREYHHWSSINVFVSCFLLDSVTLCVCVCVCVLTSVWGPNLVKCLVSAPPAGHRHTWSHVPNILKSHFHRSISWKCSYEKVFGTKQTLSVKIVQWVWKSKSYIASSYILIHNISDVSNFSPDIFNIFLWDISLKFFRQFIDFSFLPSWQTCYQ